MTTRRDLLPLLIAAAAPLAAAKLPNDVLGAGKAKLSREPFGDLRVYFDGPTGQLKAMTAGSLELKPGMTPHEPHQHPEEEILLVTEGAGEIFLDGKSTKVGPGSMMYSAAGRLHGIINTGSTPLTFFYFKWRS